MNVTFRCPQCDTASRIEIALGSNAQTGPLLSAPVCPQCGWKLKSPATVFEGERLTQCMVCPSTDLFVRKDFPQKLGVGIVVFGFAVSCLTWYFYLVYLTFGVLFATAAIDVLLYVLVGDNLTCYRCDAQYRGLPDLTDHTGFDLSTHERYRQMAARIEQHRSVQTPTAGQ